MELCINLKNPDIQTTVITLYMLFTNNMMDIYRLSDNLANQHIRRKAHKIL